MTHAIAIVLQVASTFITAFGYWLINKDRPWLGNTLVFTASLTLGTAALRFAPQSMVAPLGSLTVAWSAVLAWSEGRPTNKGLILCVLMACTLLVVAFPKPEKMPVLDENWYQTWGLAAQVWASGVVLVIGWRNSVYEAAALGGITTGFTDTHLKAFLMFGDWRSAVFLLMPCAVQVGCFNWALSKERPEKIVPVYVTCSISSVVLTGILSFHEFTKLTTIQILCYVLVCGIGITSAHYLHYAEEPPATEEEKATLV